MRRKEVAGILVILTCASLGIFLVLSQSNLNLKSPPEALSIFPQVNVTYVDTILVNEVNFTVESASASFVDLHHSPLTFHCDVEIGVKNNGFQPIDDLMGIRGTAFTSDHIAITSFWLETSFLPTHAENSIIELSSSAMVNFSPDQYYPVDDSDLTTDLLYIRIEILFNVNHTIILTTSLMDYYTAIE